MFMGLANKLNAITATSQKQNLLKINYIRLFMEIHYILSITLTYII